MLHYQIPSTEYSNYIGHVVNLGLAEDYIAHLRATCATEKTPANRIHAVEQACRHLSGVVDELQPVPVFAQVSLAIQPAGHSYVASISQADAGAALQSADAIPAADPNSAVDAGQLIQAVPEAAQANTVTHAQKTAANIFRVSVREWCCSEATLQYRNATTGMPAGADLPVVCLPPPAVTGLSVPHRPGGSAGCPWLSVISRSCALQGWCKDRGFADADLLSEAKGLEFATFLVDHGKQRNGLPYTWNSIWWEVLSKSAAVHASGWPGIPIPCPSFRYLSME